MESLESTRVEEQANMPTAFTPKKEPDKLVGVKMIGSARNRYKALRQLNVPHAEAVELSQKTFSELKEMGYKFGSLPSKSGKKSMTHTSRRIHALKTIGVTKNLQKLSKKTFAELKQMGLKFSSQMPEFPGENLVTQSAEKLTRNSSEIPVSEIPRYPPKAAHNEILPTQPPQQQPHPDQTSIRVGIQDVKPMTESQLETLSHIILEEIAGMPQGEGPSFKGYSRKPGWLVITCDDQRSKDWLEELIPNLKPWPEAKLEVIPESELPKPNIAVVFIPNIDTTMIEKSLSLIRAQNALDTELWKVVNTKAQNNGVILTLSLDSTSVENLKKMDLKASLGFNKVQFRLKGRKAHQSGTEFPLPQDQNLPGTSSAPSPSPTGKGFAPTTMFPSHPITEPSVSSQVLLRSFRDRESPSRTSNRGTGYREVHHRHPSTERYIGREVSHGGSNSSYSGITDISGSIRDCSRYNSRENIREDTDESIRSTNYSSTEDIRRENNRGSGCRAREDYERASYSGDENVRRNIAGGTSYYSRQDNSRGDSYSRREDFRGDFDDDSSYGGQEYFSPSCRSREDISGVNYCSGEDIDEDSSYSGREYFQRSASYSCRENSRRNVYEDESIRRNRGGISSDISNSYTEGIRSNEIQHQYSMRGSNNDGSVFREISPQLSSSAGNFSNRVMESDRVYNEGIPSFEDRSGGQTNQRFPPSKECYRKGDKGQDIRNFNGGNNSFGGRMDRQVYHNFPPSTGFYRDIGDIRGICGDTTGLRGRRDSQIDQQFPPNTDDFRDRNYRANIREINVGGNFEGREDIQNRETSSNWGNSGISTMGNGCTRESQGYTAGVMHGHTRGDAQRYTREINRRDSQRYANDDGQGYRKGYDQYYTKRNY